MGKLGIHLPHERTKASAINPFTPNEAAIKPIHTPYEVYSPILKGTTMNHQSNPLVHAAHHYLASGSDDRELAKATEMWLYEMYIRDKLWAWNVAKEVFMGAFDESLDQVKDDSSANEIFAAATGKWLTEVHKRGEELAWVVVKNCFNSEISEFGEGAARLDLISGDVQDELKNILIGNGAKGS